MYISLWKVASPKLQIFSDLFFSYADSFICHGFELSLVRFLPPTNRVAKGGTFIFDRFFSHFLSLSTNIWEFLIGLRYDHQFELFLLCLWDIMFFSIGLLWPTAESIIIPKSLSCFCYEEEASQRRGSAANSKCFDVCEQNRTPLLLN